jgi:hypothetical protein
MQRFLLGKFSRPVAERGEKYFETYPELADNPVALGEDTFTSAPCDPAVGERLAGFLDWIPFSRQIRMQSHVLLVGTVSGVRHGA